MKQVLNILLVDPDSQARQAFVQQVARMGDEFHVVQADSLAAVGPCMEAESFDVMVAEYQLGDGTAFDLLHSSFPLPLVVATAQGSEQTAVSLMKAGAYDYLVKDAAGKYLPHLVATVVQVKPHQDREDLSHILTHALMCIHDSVFITDMDGVILFVNQAFVTAYGYEQREIVGSHVKRIFNGDGLPPEMEQEDPLGWSGEVYHTRRDGRRFPVSLSRSVVLDHLGRHLAVVGVARDITARRQAEDQIKASLKEKEVLLREIHHRVKNNLQVVSSLLNLQTGYIQDSRVIEALRDSQNRVKSMALIHERLYQSRVLTKIDLKDYLESLVGHVKSSYRGVGDVKVQLDVERLYLDVDSAIPCGLVVNELVSNALKHAFPGGATGMLQVSLHESGGELLLDVSDDGVGFPPDLEFDRSQSLGLQLVSMLARQIRGHLEIVRGCGANIRMRFPMPSQN